MRVVQQAAFHHVSKKQAFQAHTLTALSESLTVTVIDSHSHSMYIVDGFAVVYHRTVQRAELAQHNTSDTRLRHFQVGSQAVTVETIPDPVLSACELTWQSQTPV